MKLPALVAAALALCAHASVARADDSLDRLIGAALDPRPGREPSVKAPPVGDEVLRRDAELELATGLVLPRAVTVLRRDTTRVKVTASVGPKMTGLIVKGQW